MSNPAPSVLLTTVVVKWCKIAADKQLPVQSQGHACSALLLYKHVHLQTTIVRIFPKTINMKDGGI